MRRAWRKWGKEPRGYLGAENSRQGEPWAQRFWGGNVPSVLEKPRGCKKAGEGARRFKAGRRWSRRGQGEAAVMAVLMSREDSEFTLMRWAAIRGCRAWGARLLITFQQHPPGWRVENRPSWVKVRSRETSQEVLAINPDKRWWWPGLGGGGRSPDKRGLEVGLKEFLMDWMWEVRLKIQGWLQGFWPEQLKEQSYLLRRYNWKRELLGGISGAHLRPCSDAY